MAKKLNCWEYMKCGREKGGVHADEFGTCEACLACELDSIHQGRNGGRCCWIVAGTLCHGDVQGTFASKLDTCENCPFYTKVQTEEEDLEPNRLLIKKHYLEKK